MELKYHKGNNFGDALNPLIFGKLLPGYFNSDPDTVFLGIGSILGGKINARKKIVFSSGYAAFDSKTYGDIPVVDESYDILCVRGPLTAKILGISSTLAITDGAALLKFLSIKPVSKKYSASFIPHVGSEDFYSWKKICSEAGIHYISPKGDIHKILDEIMSSELIIAEAMHGAIVADTLRVPWIPVRAYKTINSFKWEDWTTSLSLKYSPIQLPSLFNKDILKGIVRSKSRNILPQKVEDWIASTYYSLQFRRNEKAATILDKIKHMTPYLSKDNILDLKAELLLDKLELFKKKYPPAGV